MEWFYYSVFKTQWGWFGLLASDAGLVRTCLPQENKEDVLLELQKDIERAMTAKYRLIETENAVKDYYRGVPVNFSDMRVNLSAMTEFQRRVLVALRTVKHGQTVTYGQLARLTGAPKAARAIGGCMAKNPLPLIIPCHRVVGSNGYMGGFSAPGGVQTKKKMLLLEASCDTGSDLARLRF